MDTTQQLYFIALVPDDVICAEVLEFKKLAFNKFKAKKALKAIAHITLIPPFHLTRVDKDVIISKLSNFTKQLVPFEITISGFSNFNSRVLFLDIVSTTHLVTAYNTLTSLFKDQIGNRELKARTFHPHITIIQGDMKEETFKKAQEYFNKFNYTRLFVINQIALFRLSNSQWVIDKAFSLALN